MAIKANGHETSQVGIAHERAKLVPLAICARALLRTIEECQISVGRRYANAVCSNVLRRNIDGLHQTRSLIDGYNGLFSGRLFRPSE